MSPLPRFAAAALLAFVLGARADEPAARVAPLPAYQQECGACHVAFPVALLPATSWQHLMTNLPRHYGSDASMDPATTREIASWLQAHAGTGRRTLEPPPEDRITRSAWFQREHDEVAASTWKRPAIGKASNCAACHTRAAEGRYGEHEIRIPR